MTCSRRSILPPSRHHGLPTRSTVSRMAAAMIGDDARSAASWPVLDVEVDRPELARSGAGAPADDRLRQRHDEHERAAWKYAETSARTPSAIDLAAWSRKYGRPRLTRLACRSGSSPFPACLGRARITRTPLRNCTLPHDAGPAASPARRIQMPRRRADARYGEPHDEPQPHVRRRRRNAAAGMPAAAVVAVERGRSRARSRTPGGRSPRVGRGSGSARRRRARTRA